MIEFVEFFFFVAIAMYIGLSRKPTSVSDDRLGHLGEPCHVCGHEAAEPWHESGVCWYQSS